MYKFHTVISESGLIQVPDNSKLFNKEVDVIIFSKNNERQLKNKAKDFVKKWARFLKTEDADQCNTILLC